MVAFSYRPKFVDIRVKPAKGEARPEPNEAPCDHIGCGKAGGHRAPKRTGGKGQYWSFCMEHAGEYNRGYDFFRDMSEEEVAAHQRAEETGHRPTWSFKAARGDRVSAGRFWRAAKPGDAFGLFGAEAAGKPAPAPRRRVGRVQSMALEALSLDENADANTIRTRYAELVKRYHPDSNGGDRSAEAQLQKVIRAFKTLKAAGLV